MSGTDTLAPPPAPPTLLLVDDEPNILSSLQRVFRPAGYRVLTATGGALGLEILAKEKIDLIISDMRMPGMDGAAFLGQAAVRWPQVVRILLTGYADLTSAVMAVNKGNIYRYLSKPWEDNDIRITVQQALEKQRLEARVAEQNAQLKDLNANLEARVAAQTQEIGQVLGQLQVTHDELKKSFMTSVRVFASLIELREGELSGHSRRVAEQARNLAHSLDMSDIDQQDIMYGGLLRDIGTIGLPDGLINKPYTALSSAERITVAKHPITGQLALLALEPLNNAALMIRGHHERFDGKGYPDGLAGEKIPLGARVLAVVNDYAALQRGTLVEGKRSAAEARAFVIENRGQRYDPRVVDAFVKLLDELPAAVTESTELYLSSDNLRQGMVLASDLLNGKGMLLLPKGRQLNAAVIDKIRYFEREEDRGYTVHVKK